MYGRLYMHYSLVRRSPTIFSYLHLVLLLNINTEKPAAPRLACIRPTASVYSEPESNSSDIYFVF